MSERGFRLGGTLAAILFAAFLTGCATPPTDPADKADFLALNDPLEPTNRAIFQFNLAVDKAVLKPVALGYRAIVPEEGRRGVHNFLGNLRTPLVFANDVLQAEQQRAGTTLVRFVVNSTVGIFGIFDVAGKYMNMPGHDEDFGQTLAVWGVPDGPYLMLPLLGPSNPRDATGEAVQWFADPVDIYLSNTDREWLSWTRLGFETVDRRVDLLDTLDNIERTSLDYYASIRSIYRQKRLDEIRNSRSTGNAPVPGTLSGTPSGDNQAALPGN